MEENIFEGCLHTDPNDQIRFSLEPRDGVFTLHRIICRKCGERLFEERMLPTGLWETTVAPNPEDITKFVPLASLWVPSNGILTPVAERVIRESGSIVFETPKGTLVRTPESAVVKFVPAVKPTKAVVVKETDEDGEAHHNTKYDYPADCNTPELRKKFRVAARKAAKRG